MAIVTMTVNDKVIETSIFPDAHLKIEGYLQGLKLDMIERNEDIIDLTVDKPQFVVEIVSRKIIPN
ncbi:MAG TPA: hypothetical protein VM888_00485 [Chitinophagaceae bacterium]|jgi:hypothetical protein|nr:hypothetical protein [Chitinophagaceae bacterium]